MSMLNTMYCLVFHIKTPCNVLFCSCFLFMFLFNLNLEKSVVKSIRNFSRNHPIHNWFNFCENFGKFSQLEKNKKQNIQTNKRTSKRYIHKQLPFFFLVKFLDHEFTEIRPRNDIKLVKEFFHVLKPNSSPQ